jgi:hypothetical protein
MQKKLRYEILLESQSRSFRRAVYLLFAPMLQLQVKPIEIPKPIDL